MSANLDIEKAPRALNTTQKLLDSEKKPTRPSISEEAEVQEPSISRPDYLKVLGLFLVYFISIGQLAASSTYQDYYEVELLENILAFGHLVGRSNPSFPPRDSRTTLRRTTRLGLHPRRSHSRIRTGDCWVTSAQFLA
jgi:hypothetical protein